MKDIRILGFSRDPVGAKMGGPQYYRIYLPLREVNRHDNGIETEIIANDTISGISEKYLASRDVYTMSRMYHRDCDEVIDYIHSMGAVLVLDTDDDLTETYKLVSGHGEDFKVALGKVDYATVATQPLADMYSQYTKVPPVVLQNHVDVEWMQEIASKARRLVEGLTIGFSGSPTHWGDWRMPSVPLQRVVRDLDVTAVLHGEMPRYMKYVADRDTLIELGGVPFAAYPALLKQFDVVLCAVDTRDRFNDGKSDVKALECMAIGVVPLCSQFGPYMALRAAGAPVIIVEEDTQDGWYEAMRKVVDVEYREDLAARGPDWVLEHRDMRMSGHKLWAEFYRSIGG